MEKFLPLLLRLKDDANNKALGQVFRSFLEHSVERKVALPVLNPLVLWRDWASELSQLSEEPQELEILGSSEASFCVQFVFTSPKGQDKLFSSIFQVKDVYMAGA